MLRSSTSSIISQHADGSTEELRKEIDRLSQKQTDVAQNFGSISEGLRTAIGQQRGRLDALSRRAKRAGHTASSWQGRGQAISQLINYTLALGDKAECYQNYITAECRN